VQTQFVVLNYVCLFENTLVLSLCQADTTNAHHTSDRRLFLQKKIAFHTNDYRYFSHLLGTLMNLLAAKSKGIVSSILLETGRESLLFVPAITSGKFSKPD